MWRFQTAILDMVFGISMTKLIQFEDSCPAVMKEWLDKDLPEPAERPSLKRFEICWAEVDKTDCDVTLAAAGAPETQFR